MKTRLVILIIMLFSLIIPAVSVYASIPQPDSTPTITNIHVNRNLYVSGDSFVYFNFNIPYASPPTLGADQTFYFRLFSPDGATELGYNTPFIYKTNGYGQGISALYFSTGLIWNSGYILKITENPLQFDTPVSIQAVLSSSYFSTATTQTDNRNEVAVNLGTMVSVLNTAFSQTLIGANYKLTDDGEGYFRGAIPGMEGIVPEMFIVQKIPTSPVDTTTFATTQSDVYSTRFNTSWVGTSANATGEQFGMGGSMAMGMFVIVPICLALIIFSSMKFRRAEPGFLVCFLPLTMGLLLGWMPMAIYATIIQACGIYVAWLFFGARADSNRYIQFLTTAWFMSTVICLIMEGVSWSNHNSHTIINNLSLFETYPVFGIFKITVFSPSLLNALVDVTTWNYSFYTDQFQLIRWFWLIALTPGFIYSIVTLFVQLWATIISILRPSVI